MKMIETNLNFKKLSYGNIPMMIVLHHSSSKKMNVFDIHRYHKTQRGWSGIGYHFFISKDGEVYRGRPENAIGAHCKGFNKDTIGICVQGNYMEENMPIKQKQAIIDLCKYLSKKYKMKMIKGHKELKPTLCPGLKYPLQDIKDSVLKPKEDTYTVQSGDTLYCISKRFNIEVSELKKLNNLKSNIIFPRQILRIL